MKDSETKYVERYDYWQCEKCGCKHPATCPGHCGVLWCPDCGRVVIASLPLDIAAAV